MAGIMTAQEYESATFAGWRTEAGDDWQAYVDHPFVRGLGDGTLPRPAFLHYLVQDYIFLVHFSRAWALGVVKSASLEEMKVCAGTVNALVNEEMQLHIGICREAGIDEGQLYAASEEVENLAYTRFVMDAGLSGDFLDLMAALTPCVFGYGEIGSRLAQQAAGNTPYRDWIDTYAGGDYQELCVTIGAMLDRAAHARLGEKPQDNPRWKGLCKTFARASRLEAGFWDMGLRGAA